MRHILVVMVVASARVAFAQEAVTVQDADPTKSPGFMTLDRQDGRSAAGVEAAYLFFSDTGSTSVTPLRFDLYGRYIDPVSGFGGYAQLPVSYVSESAGGQSVSVTGFGDLELGGIFVPKINSPGLGAILHAGLTLPTGSSAMGGSATSPPGAEANIVTLIARVDDFFQFVPKGVSLRLGGSPVYRSGQFFARADFGIDLNLSHEGNGTVDSFMHVNVAGGLDLGDAAVTLEIVNVYDTKSMSGDFGSNWINEGAATVRFMAGKIQPYGGYVFPMDHDSYQLLGKFDGAITVGAMGLID